MLQLLGSRRTLCDGLTRRDFLHVGALGAFGFGLDNYYSWQQAQAAPVRKTPTFGKAKACILLFPYGSPPQHETFDPKPDAPAEVQGEMKAIATSVPGLRICEYLPQIARVMDRVTVVRSMTHPYPMHGVAYAVSGIPTYTPDLETRPRDSRHWPFIGSVVDYLETQRARGPSPQFPRNVGLPWLLNSKTDLNVSAGPYASFLGQSYDPIWTDFNGKGLKLGPKCTDGQAREFEDPFASIGPNGRFQWSSGNQPPPIPDIERTTLRRSLLSQFDRARGSIDSMHETGAFDKCQQMAFSLVTSPQMRDALDIGREPFQVRNTYGMTLFGQSCLAARRLVEAGCKFISVFWDGFGQFAGCAWDTHANHYPRLKEYLLPGFDQAYVGLINDLDARGLLDETLVLWMSEHGRTPRIDSKPKGAGRHHWSRAYSAVFAGGGFARGRVVGSTDRFGGEVHTTPVSPKDILATSFHLLGINPVTTIPDRLGRPTPIAGDGQVRTELLT